MFTSIAAVTANRNDSLIAFGDAVLLAADTGNLDGFLAAVKAADKPAPARKARKAKQEATKVAVKGWKAQPMSDKQAIFIVTYSDKHGFDAVDTDNWSKGKADMYIQSMIAMVKADEYDTAIIETGDNAIDWDTDGRDDSGYADSDATSRWIERIEASYA